MKRKLYTSSNQCPFNCIYCFSKFSQYDSSILPSIENINLNEGKNAIHYPACDYDIFAVDDSISTIKQILQIEGSSISISTKASLDQKIIDELSMINSELKSSNRILKIGISITSKFSLLKYEPNAADYEERLETAHRLFAAGIKTSLVLKPLLKNIPVGEYKTIVKDFNDVVHAVLVGHEYIDESLLPKSNSSFLKYRMVNWLPKTPEWPCYNMNHYIQSIENYCRELELPCFDSDRDLMKYLINK